MTLASMSSNPAGKGAASDVGAWLHQWRQWAHDERLPIGKFNQREPFVGACGDCGKPKDEHPVDRRVWAMRRDIKKLRALEVPEEAIRPIEEWAERNLTGWRG